MTTLPTSLARFQHELEIAIRRDRTRHRRRLALRGGITVAAAAIALGALSAIPRTGPSAVERAAAALRATDGTILHTVLVGTLTGADGSMDVRIETWQASSPPHDQLQIITAGDSQFEAAMADGVGQLYDPQTNTIYTSPPQPNHAQTVDKARATKWRTGGAAEAGASGKEKGTVVAADDTYRTKILGLLESGKVREAGRQAVNGRSAIRLVSDDGRVTLLVDADTYEPIEWRVSEGGQTAVTSFPTYERLPTTAENAALLSLTRRHPEAILDDNPAHYRAAVERLNPKLR